MPHQFFCMVNGTPRNVPLHQMKFHVDAKEHSGLVGTWCNGKLYIPDMAQFRAALPYRWRKAFDRQAAIGGNGFWFDFRNNSYCQINLLSSREKYLATIYCQFKESL